jgi:signal transduction histidine kinase
MNAKATTRTTGNRSPKSPLGAPTTQDKYHLDQDFLENSLESIIAGVAVERTRADKALRALAGRLIQAQEEERRRLARELHDGLNQQLAMLAVELGMLSGDEKASAVQQQIARLRDRAERLSNDLRRMTHRLHPAALEHLGLISALRSHCAEFSRSEVIQVSFHVGAELRSVHPDVAVCLYRITQEALRNVARHSRSQQASVEINLDTKGIHLSIADKGVGFDLKSMKRGLGIISIQERVQLLLGSVTIKTAPGQGTCMEVVIPVDSRGKRKSNRRRRSPKSEGLS